MTCLDVVRRALRMLGVLKLDDEPTPSEADTGLEALQGLYLAWVHGGTFGSLNDVVVTADYTAEEFDRIFNTTGAAVTITLPETVDNECTGDARPPKDGACVVVAGSTTSTHIYDSHNGAWVEIEGLALSDTPPLYPRLQTGLSALLAMDLAPEHGVGLAPHVLAMAARAKSALLTRPNSARNTTQTNYF